MEIFVRVFFGLVIVAGAIGWSIVTILATLRIFSIDRTLKQMLAVIEGKSFNGRFFPPREDDRA